MKKYLSKLFMLSFFILALYILIPSVGAKCYKITEKTDNKVSYNVTYDSWMKTSNNYVIEEVADNKCNSVRDTIHDNGDNYDEGNVVRCGGGLLTDIPKIVPKTIHIIYLLIQVAVPILLVIFGSLDFVKAMISQKDEEIKRGQQTFIKRLIYGIIVFFVFSIVKIIISFAADNNGKGLKIINCASCLVNNDSNCVSGS